MAKFDVDFEYFVPEWGTVDGIVAETEEEASQLALKEIEFSFPEAQDVLVTKVTLNNGE